MMFRKKILKHAFIIFDALRVRRVNEEEASLGLYGLMLVEYESNNNKFTIIIREL